MLPKIVRSDDVPFAVSLTNAMLIGLIPVWILASAISYFRFRLTYNKVLNVFR